MTVLVTGRSGVSAFAAVGDGVVSWAANEKLDSARVMIMNAVTFILYPLFLKAVSAVEGDTILGEIVRIHPELAFMPGSERLRDIGVEAVRNEDVGIVIVQIIRIKDRAGVIEVDHLITTGDAYSHVIGQLRFEKCAGGDGI